MKITLFVLATVLALCYCDCLFALEPEIVGSTLFCNQVRLAFQLLNRKDPNAYSIATNYIVQVREGPRSEMLAYKDPPTFQLSDVTAFYSLSWCAAAIAHDSFHSKLYHDYKTLHPGHVPDVVWTGMASERLCMAHQISVMRRIGAPDHELEHAQKQAGGEYKMGTKAW
jgi:hypothetical protein